MKYLCHLALCAALLANSMPITVEANEFGGNVRVTVDGDTVTIGNGYITKTFNKTNGKWKTQTIENHRINETFQPQEGSEDFIINLLSDQEVELPDIVYPTNALNREGWDATLTTNSGAVFEDASVLFDGDKNTYVNEYLKTGLPISLEINLGAVQQVSSFSFLKRPGYSDPLYGVNGTLGKFKLYVSDDGQEWQPAGDGEFTKEDYNLHEEDGLYNVGDVVYANFAGTYQTQYVKIEMLSDALGNTQEFSGAEINLYADKLQQGLPVEEINLAGKTVTFKGETTEKLSDGVMDFALKGNVDDEIIIDLGSTQAVGSFAYQKRPGYQDANYGKNGTMGKYQIYVSNDNQNWIEAGSGEFTSEDYNLHSVTLTQDTTTSDGSYHAGDVLHNVGDLVYGNLDQVHQARYIKIVPKSDCMGGTNEFQVSEIKVFADRKFEPEVQDTDIRSSELTVSENGITTTENEVRVSFDTYEKDGVQWDIDMVTVMEDHKHYMNSYLEITADQPEKVAIDYIDFDRYVIPQDAKDVWSIPDENQISSQWIGKHELMLGQPIYADGLFFGSEFPVQDTDVKNENEMQIRYYSGKTIAKMAEDHQNVLEDGKTFRTWNNVVGAAQGTPTDVVQTDFFDYIEDIATPSDFRKQYNSWYDNMMGINDESIERSFLGAEKGLSENGVEPLDSYVVDDGWNTYNNEIGGVNSPNDSGTTNNQTGFWEFNSKFPNELYTSSSLSDKLQSTFGLWVGPQGGYNHFTGFAKYLEAMGTGEMQTNSALGSVICTGSRTYLKNFESRFIDYQTRFNIDYWKWDGFASRPCDNPDHNHMTGGDHNMYFTSDMWEGWTDLIENAREARAQEGKGLWINATCYVNLSPWLLQWVNSIWVQDSGDTGEAGDVAAERHQRKIYYRDNVYYNLYKNNQIQFPLKNIYNHDPIYGVSDGSNATTEAFREFLFDNAMRGTAFWELYYSPSIMDDAKWKVTVDALDFAETNHDVLKNAKLFVQEGKNPTNGVYGYSAWNGDQGFVSFVNPTAETQTYTLTLDNLVGVPTTMQDLKEYQIYPYTAQTSNKTVSYGEQLEITLEPFTSQIYQYGTLDQSAPEIVSAKIVDETTIEVRFNERVSDTIVFQVNGQELDKTLMEDYRTFQLTSEHLGESEELTITNIKDIFGNTAEDYRDEIRTSKDIVDGIHKESKSTSNENGSLSYEQVELTDKGIEGTSDFSVSMTVQTLENNVTLLQQGDDYRIEIDAEGYIKATVKDDVVTSKQEVKEVVRHASGLFGTSEYQESEVEVYTTGKVNDGQLHTVQLVRELNGVLKLYFDGELASSFYDENNKNQALDGDAVVVGDENFIGYIADLHVTNSAVYYDDAQAYATEYNVNTTAQALDKTKWTAQACSQASDTVAEGIDGSAASVLDNNTKTYWHSNYSGADTHEGPHTLQVNFNETITFDRLEYVARPNGSNGNWQSAKVYGLHNGEKELLMEVDQITLVNNAYQFIFDAPQTYDGVLFEIEGIGNYASAAEINALENVKKVDISNVMNVKKEAKELFDHVDEAMYTEASYTAFVQAYEAVMNLDADASQQQITDTYDAFHAAYKNLTKPVAIDKKALYQLLLKYTDHKASDYTKESWDPFFAAYKHGVDVYNDPNVSQKDVDEAAKDLETKASQLVLRTEEDPSIDQNEDETTKVPDEIKPSESPNTGQDSYFSLFASIALLSGGAIVWMMHNKKRLEEK